MVGVVAGLALLPGLTDLASRVGIPPGALGQMIGQRALSIAQHVAFAYLAIGALDYAWKRRQHERQLRMTKQEVKDERASTASPPEVKTALRRRQMQAARARMMAAVPRRRRGRDQPDALRRGADLRRLAHRARRSSPRART